MAVLLDVVYNHFGPAGNYLREYSQEYFTHERTTAWGDALNLDCPFMRRYILDNARYWLEEFGFDGLRLDATHAMLDQRSPSILAELAQLASSMDRVIVAEDGRNDPSLSARDKITAQWADDFHHQVRVLLTGERDGYYAAYQPSVADLARTIEQGWLYEGQIYPLTGKPRGAPGTGLEKHRFIYCIQNHDQIGNRAHGTRLHHEVDLDAYCAASMLLLYLPMVPLLFMGQEWAASSPFLYFTDHDADLAPLISRGRRDEFAKFAAFADPAVRANIPDPQELETFMRSKLRWDERASNGHGRVLGLYIAMLQLRREDPVLRPGGRGALVCEARGSALAVTRISAGERRLLVANFGEDPVSLFAPKGHDGQWVQMLCSGRGGTGSSVLGRTATLFRPSP